MNTYVPEVTHRQTIERLTRERDSAQWRVTRLRCALAEILEHSDEWARVESIARDALAEQGRACGRLEQGPVGDARPWQPLGELRPGAIFETRDGIFAVKSEYHYTYGGIECVLLASGEYAHFDQPGLSAEKHNATEVRELELVPWQR